MQHNVTEFTFYCPHNIADANGRPKTPNSARVKEFVKTVTEICGGVTTWTTVGSWESSDKNVITESVEVVSCLANEMFRNDLINAAMAFKADMNQVSLLYTERTVDAVFL